MIKIDLIILLICVIGLSCSNQDQDNEYRNVSLRQEWFPYSGYAGEVIAINETDTLFKININLEAGSDNIDPIKLVISGENDFGVVSADRILTANDKGAELVVIGVINYKSPTCFIAMDNLIFETPYDFIGKKIGVLTGTNTELVYKALKLRYSIRDNDIKEVEIPFDLNTFINHIYDVRPAFIYDEPVSLDMKNIKYKIIDPADFNVNFIGTVYFTRKSFVQENPEVVKSFVYALAKGWEEALAKPDKAIKYLKSFDSDINIARETESLIKGKSYFEGEDRLILYASEKQWKKMAEDLIQLGIIDSFNFEETVDNRFVMDYHKGK